MTFWRTFGFHSVSSIETLLDKDSFTLEELLDEEDLLSECKSQNQKLMDYLLRPETLTNLLNYLTLQPAPDADVKVRQKYPYLACEILCLEVWDICEAIYDNPVLLSKLWSFLDKEPPLPPFAVRVAGVLLQRKIGDSIAYLRAKPSIVDRFMLHIGNSSVNELLVKLIQCDETQEGAGIVKLMSDQNLVDALVEKLNPKYSPEEHENVGQTLVEIITSNSHGCALLLEQLQSESVFRSLFTSISESNSKSSLFWGLQVAIEVIKKDSYLGQDSEGIPPYIRVCGDHLSALSHILSGNSSERLVTTIGQVVPVGTHRLKLVEFFSVLLSRNYDVFDNLLLDYGVFEACLAMFFQYHWNNFLHSAVADMVIAFLSTRPPEKSFRFISECTLVDRICEASSENDKDVSNPKGFSRGYIGFIDKISNKLNDIAESDSSGLIANYLKSHPGWRQYVESTLQKHNADSSIVLGGQKPSADDVGQSSGDEEGPPASNEPINVFSQYLVKQGFTNDFPKDFLADDDDEHDDEEADDLGNLAFDKIFDKLLGEPYRTDDSDEEDEDYIGNESKAN